MEGWQRSGVFQAVGGAEAEQRRNAVPLLIPFVRRDCMPIRSS